MLSAPLVLLSSALLLSAAPPRAERLQLPCKLPARADYRLVSEQQGWSRDGTPRTVAVSQLLHFDRDAGGSRLVLGRISARGDLEEAERQRLAAALGPAMQAPVTLLLDAQGRIVRVEDLARHWSAFLAMIERIAHDMEAAGQSGERARAMLAALAGSDDTARIGIVASQAGPLLRHCGQSVEATGEAGLAVVTTRTDTPEVSETARYRIDPLTGLARSIERRTVLAARPDRPLVERWRFDPLP